jgi:hypothetical protein
MAMRINTVTKRMTVEAAMLAEKTFMIGSPRVKKP